MRPTVLFTRRMIGVTLAVLLLGIGTAFVVGLRPLVIRSDSMAPAFRSGDVLVVRTVAAGAVAVGDVVTFADSSRGGALVSHRVVAVEQRGGERAFVTRGDQNSGVEHWVADVDGTVGIAVLTLPKVGFVVGWLVMPQVRLLIALAAAVLLGSAALRKRLAAGVGPRRATLRLNGAA